MLAGALQWREAIQLNYRQRLVVSLSLIPIDVHFYTVSVRYFNPLSSGIKILNMSSVMSEGSAPLELLRAISPSDISAREQVSTVACVALSMLCKWVPCSLNCARGCERRWDMSAEGEMLMQLYMKGG